MKPMNIARMLCAFFLVFSFSCKRTTKTPVTDTKVIGHHVPGENPDFSEGRDHGSPDKTKDEIPDGKKESSMKVDFNEEFKNTNDITQTGNRLAAYHKLFREWSRDNPDESLKEILKMSAGQFRNVAFGEWALNVPLGFIVDLGFDPPEGLYPDEIKGIQSAVLAQAKRKSAGEILDYLARPDLPESMKKEFSRALGMRLGLDGASLDEVLRSVPETGRRGAVFDWTVGISLKDPESAKDQYVAAFEQGKVSDISPLGGLVQNSFNSNPEKTKEWVSNLENPKLCKLGTSVLVSVMYRLNVDSAAEWLNSLESGEAKDVGIVSLVNGLIYDKDYESAKIWMNEIGDRHLKESIGKTIPSNQGGK